MLTPEITLELTQLIESRQHLKLRGKLTDINNVDIAEFMESLPTAPATIVFRLLPKDAALHVFSELEPEAQHQIVEAISDGELANFIDDLWVDDTMDMLEEMPATLVKKVLRNSSPETRQIINQFFQYPEDSVGSIMTVEFIELKKHMKVGYAIEHIRSISDLPKAIYTCFVTDDTRILEGSIDLKDLLLANDNLTIEELLIGEPIFVTTTTDKEDAVRVLMKYDLITLPIVDHENRLVGIVTIDDAIDTLIEEDTEDFERMAAVTPSERPYMKSSVFALAKNRFPWLTVSLLTNIVITFVVNIFVPVYVAIPILYSFIPMLMGTGGNAGSQTSTLIIRGMALGEISFTDFWQIIWKEFRVSLLISVLLGLFCFVRILFTSGFDPVLALIVTVGLISAIMVGKIFGAILPLLAKKVNIDPALMAAPLVTTIVDILTIVIYFSFAASVYGISLGGGIGA